MKQFCSLQGSGGLFVMLAMTLSLASCQQKASEEFAEKIIEHATGEDVELDVDGENLSLKTREGTINVSSEGENRMISMRGKDGSSVDLQQEGKTLSIRNEKDTLNITGDSDGNTVTLERPDGSSVRIQDDVHEWPDDIPVVFPEFLYGRIVTVQTTDAPDMDMWVVIFEEVPDQVIRKYEEVLKANGFTTRTTVHSFDGKESGHISAEKERMNVAVMIGEGGASISFNKPKDQ